MNSPLVSILIPLLMQCNSNVISARWDPISKQPTFKGGAIKITKLPSTDGEVKIHAKEQQSAAEEAAAQKPETMDIYLDRPRRRGLERWLGELEQCSILLLKIFENIISKATRDPDIQNGLRVLLRIGKIMAERIQTMANKYEDDKDWGKRRAHLLADTLFFNEENKNQMDASYLVLETLQSLHVFLGYIKGSLRGMRPAAQALWDKDLIECVEASTDDVARMEEWALQQMQIKAPQSLIVPVPVVNGKM
jgi:ferredoxin-nitrate reductase